MKIIISNSSPDPIYGQISKQIKNQIISNDLKAGDLLPSIRSLAKDLQVSVITVKRSYEDLENEGFIDTVAGKGSFVAGQNPEFLRESQLKLIEERLGKIIEDCRIYGISEKTLVELVGILYKEG